MLTKSINEVIECIGQNPIFTYVKYYNDKVDGGFCGINDDCNYAYVRKQGDKDDNFSIGDSDVSDCGGFKAEGRYYLIADLEGCIDTEKALWVIISQLRECACVRVVSGSDNSEYIYKQETGKDLTDCDSNFIKVSFQVREDLGCAPMVISKESCC